MKHLLHQHRTHNCGNWVDFPGFAKHHPWRYPTLIVDAAANAVVANAIIMAKTRTKERIFFIFFLLSNTVVVFSWNIRYNLTIPLQIGIAFSAMWAARSQYAGVFSYMDNHKHPSFSDNETELFSSLHISQLTATNYDDFWQKIIKKFRLCVRFWKK